MRLAAEKMIITITIYNIYFDYYYVIDIKIDLSYGYILLKKSDKTGFFFIEKTVLVISLYSTFAVRTGIALGHHRNIPE